MCLCCHRNSSRDKYGGDPQMEAIPKNTKRLSIRSNWDIGVIEFNLKEHIGNYEIWGDLDLSIDEYRNIKSRIVDVLGQHPTASEIKNLFRKYPVTMVSDIINFVLFEFDNNDFWSSWANRFNTSLAANSQTEIGSMVREIFKKYNFEIIEDGGYTYVTPILCQAGIPCTCFNKIFDILDSTLNSPYFLAREMVDELRGYRNYLIDAPVERYFRLHTERAIDLIAGLREMMHSLGGTLSFDNDSIPYFAGVETRIIKQYVEWRAKIKCRGYKGRKSEQYFNPPKLIYDTCKGICLFLPGQVLRQDMIYKLQWVITCDDEVDTITDFSQVYNIDGRNCTNEKYVPVDFANFYTIELFDADDTTKLLTSVWRVSGINKDNPVLAFNKSGLLMSQKFISRKGTIIVFDSEQTSISDKQGVQELIGIDLPKSWSNARAFEVYPAERRALITLDTCGEKSKIECKHNFDFEFVQRGILFGEKFSTREMPVFVRFPIVEISGDVDEYKSTFDNWQVSIIHGLSNTKHTVMLSEIGITQYCDCVRFSLADYASNYYVGLYGSYEIKIYDGKTRHDLSFYMSPAIEYSGIIENISEEMSLFRRKAGFYFKNIDTVELEFENGVKVIPTPTRGIGWNQAFTDSNGAFIKGQIGFEYAGNKYKIPFKKTIRKLQWQFWNETQNKLEEYGAKLFYSYELEDEKWRLALHFTDTNEVYDVNKIVLESSSGEPLQSKDLAIDREGNCIVTMNLFQDTITAHKLPQRLMLYLSNGNDNLPPICLAVMRYFVELCNPKFTVNKERPIIYWDKGNDLSGKKLKLTSLIDPELEPLEYLLDNIKTFNGKEDIKYEGIIINKVLPNGVYRIDATENDDGFFFEDDIQNSVYTFERERILYANGRQLLDELLKRDDASLYEWLSAIVVSLCKKEWVDAIADKMQKQIEKQRFDFDINKCTSLLFFLLLATNEKSNLSDGIKEKVIDICEIVNFWCITYYDRIEILKHLIDSNMTDNDCLFIIEALQLYLFKSNGTLLFDRQYMQRMWELDENIAVLANIRKCTVDVTTDLLRISNHINSEVFEHIIKFTPTIVCKTSEWLDCFGNVLSGKCRCDKMRFECSKRVWGDGYEWSKLFTKVKSDYLLIQPDKSHTDGYEIMGTNYLTLVYTLFTKKSEESSSAEKKAVQNAYRVENLLSKYNPVFTNIHNVLRKRTGEGTGGVHRIFYLIGAAAILEALAFSKGIDQFDLRELLPFWKSAIKAFPKLVYRDLIVAELSEIFKNERGNGSCQ